MQVAPDAANTLTIRFRPVPPGSCWTQDALNQFATLLVIEAPQNSNKAAVQASTQANNLTSIDAEGAVYTPADLYFKDQKDWLFSAPTDVLFSGWPLSIDATVALMELTPLYSAGDFTNTAKGCFVKSRTPTQVIVSIAGATADVSIEFKLLQPAIPPQAS